MADHVNNAQISGETNERSETAQRSLDTLDPGATASNEARERDLAFYDLFEMLNGLFNSFEDLNDPRRVLRSLFKNRIKTNYETVTDALVSLGLAENDVGSMVRLLDTPMPDTCWLACSDDGKIERKRNEGFSMRDCLLQTLKWYERHDRSSDEVWIASKLLGTWDVSEVPSEETDALPSRL